MIDKIININNVGRFSNYNVKGGSNWNGSFKKVNILYAVNGSGKTTLTNILKSLKNNDPNLVSIKRTFSSLDEPNISIKDSENSVYEFKSDKWTKNFENLEVFDIHFVEDYLYRGSISHKKNRDNLFELLLGKKGVELKKQGRNLIAKKLKQEKILFPTKKTQSTEKPTKIIKERYKDASEKLEALLKTFHKFASPIYQKQIDVTNKYLKKFAPYIEVTELKNNGGKGTLEYEVFRTFLVLKVHGQETEFLTPDYLKNIANAKFTLSEGDKSALAISFFLARLETTGVQEKVIVFDDPISSFDYSRKSRTIAELARIASKCSQLFILTHDIHFAKEFTDKISFEDFLNLKIEFDGKSSRLVGHDIGSETDTRQRKEIKQVLQFIRKGGNDYNLQLEVLRCFRPILEGAIKNKFFEEVNYNHWLGDIIGLIKNSTKADRIFILNDILDDLIDINDYTKGFHHSDSSSSSEIIDPVELKVFAELLIETVYKI